MVNIDTVYQKVLVFANKEQRGYITPQEFNLFADQAQNEIFDQYFYDLNQFSRGNRSSGEFADMNYFLKEKIDVFKRKSSVTLNSTASGSITSSCYQLGTIWNDRNKVVERVSRENLQYILESKLLKPTVYNPVYTKRHQSIYVYPDVDYANQVLDYEFIKQPSKPSWTYVIVNGIAMYDPNNLSLSDFELHHSEENELVYKILKFAGISMKREDVLKAGQGLESVNTQQQKQ